MKESFQNSIMQNEDKSKLEERVIAYFDGSLDNEGSRSLLREVAERPEARSLFKAHETLSRLIVAARTPMEAPLEVKRSIAERIPGMLAFIPGLLGTAETAPIISQNANPFLAFFARMSLTTAVSIGSVVALLTAGIVLKNNFDNSVVPASPKIVAVQSPAPSSAGMENLSAQSSFPTHQLYRTYGSHRTDRSVVAAMREMVPSAATSSNEDNAQANSEMATVTPPLSVIPVSSALANIPTIGTESLLPLPLVANEGVAIRPYASTGERFVTLNGIGTAKSTNVMEPSYLLGLEFELGDHYAFHIQGGKSYFAALTTETSQGIAPYPVIQSKVSALKEYWTTAGVSYSFQFIKSVPLILSADGGAVLTSNTGLMGMLGAATEIPIFHQLLLRPCVTYDAVWTSLPGIGSSNATAIYQNPVSSSSMLSSALGFNISLIFRP